MSHPATETLIAELRERMIVSDDMAALSPAEFWDAVRLARKEAFHVAVALDTFCRDHNERPPRP